MGTYLCRAWVSLITSRRHRSPARVSVRVRGLTTTRANELNVGVVAAVGSGRGEGPWGSAGCEVVGQQGPKVRTDQRHRSAQKT